MGVINATSTVDVTEHAEFIGEHDVELFLNLLGDIQLDEVQEDLVLEDVGICDR